MSTASFDTLARHVALGVTRRRSLLTFGGAGLAAALGGAVTADAKKGGNKKRKKKGNTRQKKVDKTCKKQVEECKEFWEDHCEEEDCAPEALEEVLECCEFLGECDASGYHECSFG